jgi:hypothetical protein
MTNTAHHLTAHWVEADDAIDSTHHHLAEVWLDEDDAPETQVLDPAAE